MNNPQLNPLLNRIRQIYIEDNTDSYIQACKRPFELPDALVQVLENAVFWLEPDTTLREEEWPSVSYLIQAPSFIEGNFKAEYRIQLKISKLFPAYRLSFDYELNNPDPEAMKPFYWGSSETPLTKSQQYFLEAWEKTAKSLGWIHLSESLSETPLSQLLQPNTAFPEESLWRHLAFDLMEFCPD